MPEKVSKFYNNNIPGKKIGHSEIIFTKFFVTEDKKRSDSREIYQVCSDVRKEMKDLIDDMRKTR